MSKILKTIKIFPTWIIMLLVRKFLPKNHPFKFKKINLHDWVVGSTELNNLFGLYIWIFILMFILLIINI